MCLILSNFFYSFWFVRCTQSDRTDMELYCYAPNYWIIKHASCWFWIDRTIEIPNNVRFEKGNNNELITAYRDISENYALS